MNFAEKGGKKIEYGNNEKIYNIQLNKQQIIKKNNFDKNKKEKNYVKNISKMETSQTKKIIFILNIKLIK